MKRSFKVTAVTMILLLVVSLSLNIVFAVSQNAEPGSEQDPIVSKSYVDAAVAQLTAKIQLLLEQNDALKTQNAQLTSRIAASEQAVKTLQESVKSGTPAATGNTGNTGNTGSTGNAGGNAAASIGKGTINTAVLNVRAQANTTSAIVGKAVSGETVTIVSKSGDWYKITRTNGKSGFVMAKFVTVNK